jgi:hypothetical protein
MKFLIKGVQEKIMNLCEEINSIKNTEKESIVKSGLKQKTAKSLANMASSVSGGLNFDDILGSFAVNYEKQDDNAVLLNIPLFIPKMVRFLLKRKLLKAFKEIFEQGCGEVDVKFISWGDEDLT